MHEFYLPGNTLVELLGQDVDLAIFVLASVLLGPELVLSERLMCNVHVQVHAVRCVG